MKFCIDKYPLGSIPNQQTAGRYISETLYGNLDILSKKIVDDMTFLGVCFSSTLEVGTGKSSFMQQIAEAWGELMKKNHNIDIPFTMNNIVFKPRDLIERSFKLPKYSVIILDEWEDAHYWSELGITLRQFFRKCRQLNLFMLVIIPNFFELSKTYAITRSIFAIDVHFAGDLERGHFKFYNFDKKKELYLKGKKEYNYYAVKPNFTGRFLKGYTVDEAEYRKRKLEDTEEVDSKNKKIGDPKEIIIKVFRQLRERMPYLKLEQWSVGFGVSERTLNKWNNKDYIENKESEGENPQKITSILSSDAMDDA